MRAPVSKLPLGLRPRRRHFSLADPRPLKVILIEVLHDELLPPCSRTSVDPLSPLGSLGFVQGLTLPHVSATACSPASPPYLFPLVKLQLLSKATAARQFRVDTLRFLLLLGLASFCPPSLLPLCHVTFLRTLLGESDFLFVIRCSF